MTQATPTVTLNNGVQMPILGFGVYQVTDLAECERSVGTALECGYRLIDTASAYLNETAVGAAIASSGVPRDELFVTTKVWVQDHGEQATLRAFDRSLERLGLDHVDLYLIHQPYGDVYGTWRAMESLLAQGRVRAIGVSNFQHDRLLDLVLHHEVTPAVNQVETHPFFQRTQYQAELRELGVQLESWGPFAEGRNDLFTHPVLSAIGRAHDRSVAQVALRWLVQRGVVAIPKSVKPERIAENLAVFDFVLAEDEMARISSLDTGSTLFFDHRDPRFVRRLGTSRLDI